MITPNLVDGRPVEINRRYPPPKDWPEAEVSCVGVQLDDERVPGPARAAARKALGVGVLSCVLTYARGTSVVGKECVPGPIMESVALRLVLADGRRAVAVWEAKSRALCECRKSLMPSTKGVFTAHRVGGVGSESCPGSGQPAVNVAGERKYAFGCAYVGDAAGWWASGAPRKVSATEFGALLSG